MIAKLEQVWIIVIVNLRQARNQSFIRHKTFSPYPDKTEVEKKASFPIHFTQKLGVREKRVFKFSKIMETIQFSPSRCRSLFASVSQRLILNFLKFSIPFHRLDMFVLVERRMILNEVFSQHILFLNLVVSLIASLYRSDSSLAGSLIPYIFIPTLNWSCVHNK